ncbi:flagellar hook capping protein [Desulfobacter hydrogenophilus]|uniref:Basal-body rod modification protein FlgD n=1 Tax=Desulfobacter hydrogenophilus TaxID=2291 RepID=A0A328FGC4_9BACT|nr:FlgD immunoglobulin-like domain containing protein [Desulfobacter hydrogenophilus]NDY70496.1 flagellar hook capping protein [Desulfobacter hydrogenophilus]QBH13873.1 flagellar hook capping protein [Desulfobacter hydrogenophilus]RAM02103.1 flagellar hook capping protein [Desulfobacter hydrogenophilus]
MSDSSILSSMVNSYEAYDAETTSTSDTGSATSLGNEEFLTLLVAQLENQNPLDPADTEQFTDQLAQFSQVEQLININDKLDEMAGDVEDSENDIDANSFVGLTVTATVTSMTIDSGSVTPGFYEVDEPAEVMVYVYDSDGTKVATLSQGEVEAGSYLISWDGTDDAGNSLDDGEYSYVVMANSGDGYKEVKSYLSGNVDAVSYQDGKGYLVINGVLVDPDDVTTVTPSSASPSGDSTSVLEYLGTTVSSSYPIVQVENGEVQGDALGFSLTAASDVRVTIYNADDEEVETIEISADDTTTGENEVTWDGLTSSGHVSSDGLYYYKVTADTGRTSIAISGDVSAITSVDGTQYLEIGDTGRLVSVSSITAVE